MKKSRSPRFPFLPLEKAIEKITTLNETDCTADFRPLHAMKALGFSSMHGRAVKIFAALRAYDLIEQSKNAKKDERLFSITKNGLKILEASQNPEKQLPFLQRAALSPGMFRAIWNRAGNVEADELMVNLEKRGFTNSGAQRAARVYLKNKAFAALDQLEVEPEGLPDRKRRPDASRPGLRVRQARPHTDGPNGLNLPLSTGRAVIPKGISEEEFSLLMQTLRLWKTRLVASSES